MQQSSVVVGGWWPNVVATSALIFSRWQAQYKIASAGCRRGALGRPHAEFGWRRQDGCGARSVIVALD